MKNTKLHTISMNKDAGTLGLRGLATAALTAAFLSIVPTTLAAPMSQGSASEKARLEALVRSGKVKKVKFKNGPIMLAGNVYFPESFDASRKYAAIVVVHPGGGVKEQTAGLYAERMAEQGFVTLAFDAWHQGESGGMPRLLESPQARVEDVRSAVDFLNSLAYVDADRIGGIGICAGSGYTIKAVTLERRIKAVATISAVDTGASARKGWDGQAPVSDQLAALDRVAAERTAIAKGAKPTLVEYVPEKFDEKTPADLREAYDYYRLPSGYMHPNAPNKMLLISLDKMLAFTGFDQVNTLLTQPLLVVAGSKAGSLWHSQELHERAASTDKELFIIDGATHMDLYVGRYVNPVVEKLIPFFKRTL